MKFQKCISFFLAFSMLFSGLGLAMKVHFCGDEIASISVNANAGDISAEDSCCGANEKYSQCCKDKVVYIEKKTDQALLYAASDNVVAILLFSFWNCPEWFFPNLGQVFPQIRYVFHGNGPPLFKLYSSYIFYDSI